MKLPLGYEERMRSLLGDSAEEYFAALDAEPSRSLRINKTKMAGDLPEMPDVTITPSGIDGVYLFDGNAGGKNPLHHAGAYYIQELSAMLPALSAPIEEGWRVLDLCAAPGGKTGQLASAVGEGGFVVTNEYSPKRSRVLLGNVERMGYKNCAVYNSTPDKLCPAFAGKFDLVLVDAPCSGEGMFRKEPDAVQDWSVENSDGCATRQMEIMRSAAAAVKPDGYLLYSRGRRASHPFSRRAPRIHNRACRASRRRRRARPGNPVRIPHRALPPCISAQGKGRGTVLRTS